MHRDKLNDKIHCHNYISWRVIIRLFVLFSGIVMIKAMYSIHIISVNTVLDSKSIWGILGGILPIFHAVEQLSFSSEKKYSLVVKYIKQNKIKY